MLTSRRPDGKGAAGYPTRWGDWGLVPGLGSFLVEMTEAHGRYPFYNWELNRDLPRRRSTGRRGRASECGWPLLPLGAWGAWGGRHDLGGSGGPPSMSR